EGTAHRRHDAPAAARKEVHTEFSQEFTNGPRVLVVLIGARTDHSNRLQRERGHQSGRAGDAVAGKVDAPRLTALRSFNPSLERGAGSLITHALREIMLQIFKDDVAFGDGGRDKFSGRLARWMRDVDQRVAPLTNDHKLIFPQRLALNRAADAEHASGA